MTDISTLHNEVLDFLLEKRKEDSNLYFTLRTNDEGGTLSKNRYWFYGNKTEIYFSFWDCPFIDTKTSKLFIGLSISPKTSKLTVQLNTDGTESISNLLIPLAQKLNYKINNFDVFEEENPLKQKKKKLLASKEYENWGIGLNYFLTSDKYIIDEFLKELLNKSKTEKFDNKIGFLSTVKFLKNLDVIESLRNDKIGNLSKEDEYAFNPKLKLQQIHLHHIGHFEDISLDLSKQVTVLIGENGSGKSTILRAIALGLTGVDFFDLDKDMFESKERILNELLKINNYQQGRIEYAQKGEIILFIDNKEYSVLLSPSQLNYEEVKAEEKNKNRKNLLHKSQFFKTLIVGFSQSVIENPNRFYRLRNREPHVTDLLSLITNTGTDMMDNLIEWIYYYVHDREDTKPVDKLFEIFSEIISEEGDKEEITIKRPYKIDGVIGSPTGEKEVIVCTKDSPNGISLRLVSQGYKNIFRWVGTMLMKLYLVKEKFYKSSEIEKIAGIILIDEIDTYLHPNWQYNILKVLVEEFKNLQFIVTTHSASVVTSLDPRKVDFLIYDVSKQQARILSEYNPFGSRIDRAYIAGLGSHDRNLQAVKDFKDLRQLIDSIKNQEQIKIAKEKVKAMKTIYDPYEADIIYAENMIRTKEMLISK